VRAPTIERGVHGDNDYDGFDIIGVVVALRERHSSGVVFDARERVGSRRRTNVQRRGRRG
jgi:hypothetical protein